MKKIETLEELKVLASQNGMIDCFIRFNGGLRSSKQIEYDIDRDEWYIFNEIDGEEQYLNTKELEDETNIIEALNKGSLYLY